jgi:hypothetical protein
MCKKMSYLLTFLVFMFGMSTTVFSQELSDGLLGYWPLDEGESTTTVDLTGNGNDGTIYGDAVWVEEGIFGTALLFDGIDDYVDLGNDEMLELGIEDFTISSWIRTSMTDGERTIFGKGGDGGGGIRYHLEIQGSNIKIITDDNGPDGSDYAKHDPSSNLVVSDSAWHHIVMVREGIKLKLYIDGVDDPDVAGHDESTVPADYSISPTVYGAYIGCIQENKEAEGNPLIKFWSGVIDDVALWDRALSADEISNIYAEETILEVEDPPSSVHGAGVSRGFNVRNYPNPFNLSTTFSYELPENSHTKLTIINSLGQEVEVLVDDLQTAGSYKVRFDGSGLSEGIYFADFQTGSYSETVKILLIK